MKCYIDKEGKMHIEAENEFEANELECWCDANINEETAKLDFQIKTEIQTCNTKTLSEEPYVILWNVHEPNKKYIIETKK